MGKGALRRFRRQCVVVDRYRMVGQDELYAGILCGHDLPHALGPDGRVEHANTLHLHHQLVLMERRILRLKPRQPFRCPQLLNIDIFEECPEMLVASGDVGPREGPDGLRSACVDIAEQLPLDLVVYLRGEECGIEVGLEEAALRGGVEQ